MTAPLVSIIVPVYNVKDFLDECLVSLVNQTYRNLEIILIDDGSTDGSELLCDVWASKDDRVNVIHTANYGVSHARNVGIDYANGEYLAFVDSDDWIEDDFYGNLLDGIQSCNADICGGGFIYDGINSSDFSMLIPSEPCIMSREEAIINIFKSYDGSPKLLSWELCDKIFKADVVKNIRLDEKISIKEDMMFLWQAMKTVKRFSYRPIFGYHYRIRNTSASHSGNKKNIISGFYAMQQIYKSIDNESKEIKQLITNEFLSSCVAYSREMILCDYVSYKDDIMQNQKYIRRHIISLIFSKNKSIRILLGGIYFCLPFWLCVLSRVLIK